jgi:integrase
MQKGQIFKKGGNWYLRFYRDEIREDNVVRLRVCKKLGVCDKGDKKDRPPDWVHLEANKILTPLNSGKSRPESTQTVSQFIDTAYLPYVEKYKRPSTLKGYADIFRDHLKDRVSETRLRDFRTFDGEHILALIAHETGLSHRSLLHIKSFLSGVFTYAKRTGVLDSINPMRDVSVPKGARGKETYAYSLEEIQTMIRVLPEPARTIVTVAAFTGLRASELRGLRWDDFSGDELRITRTVWRTHLGEPKTHASAAPIPVLSVLCQVLGEHRKRNRGCGYIFSGPSGRPTDIDSLATRVIRPALRGSGVAWHGWHAFRRSLATNLYRIGVSARTIQAILRHSNVSTTLAYYVKTSEADSVAAMERLEKEMGNGWATTNNTVVQ